MKKRKLSSAISLVGGDSKKSVEMHSALVRVQNVFGFFTTVASCIAGLIALSVVICPQTPTASLALRNIQVARGRPYYYSTRRQEYAHVRFDVDMDLSSLFTWNTKQVFVYITATYPPGKPGDALTQTIIWDAILPSKLEPWHQNQYIHPTTPPKVPGSRRIAKGQIYSEKLQPGHLTLKNQKPKYVVTDHTGLIAKRGNATLELGWNIQPWVGALTWTRHSDLGSWKALEGGQSKSFDFPEIKGDKPSDMGTVKGGEGNRGKPA